MEPQTFDRIKIGICIPTAGLIRAGTVFSLGRLIGQIIQESQGYWPEAKERGMTLLMREGSGIAPNREKMVEEALATEGTSANCTHILFIDDDMLFYPPAFESLCRRRMPIVGCNYRMRFYPPAEFTAVHLDRARGRIDTNDKSTGLEPVDYMGFGLCLIETRVFKALPQPWFLPTYIDGVYTTEDLPFYWAARKAGFTAFVDQDASKHIGHIGIREYRWDDTFPKPEEPKDKPMLSAVPSPVADSGRYPPEPKVGAG